MLNLKFEKMKRKNLLMMTIMVLLVAGLTVSCNSPSKNNTGTMERNEIENVDESEMNREYQRAVQKAEEELEELRNDLDKLDENDPDFATKLNRELDEFNEEMDELGDDLRRGGNNLSNETDQALQNARMKARQLGDKVDKWADKTGDNLEELGDDIKRNFRELKEDLKRDS